MLLVRPYTILRFVPKLSKYTVEKYSAMDSSNELSKAKMAHGGLNITSGNLGITMEVNEWQIKLPVILTENNLHFSRSFKTYPSLHVRNMVHMTTECLRADALYAHGLSQQRKL
jgi:hypothetical protein